MVPLQDQGPALISGRDGDNSIQPKPQSLPGSNYPSMSTDTITCPSLDLSTPERPLNFLEQQIKEDLEQGRHQTITTRFPASSTS